ncbi:MAG: acetylxylan esterase [Planctomycetaceae bacterium]|nr:acetylxylan esterase [Planctomycetaceae bacterium]
MLRSITTLAILSLHFAAVLNAADYKLSVTAEKESAIYETGEEAAFLVSVTHDDAAVDGATIEFKVDDFRPSSWTEETFPSGNLNLSESNRIVVTSSVPRFLKCQVSWKNPEGETIRAIAGLGFSPWAIEPGLPVPDDFDVFWAEQKRKLAKVPLNSRSTSVDHDDESIQCFDIQVDCVGTPVSGYLAKPANAQTGTLPAVLWVHGAGVRGSSLENAILGAKNGMISLDINAHGIENGKPAAFYQELSEGRLRDYRFDGRESRETSYFVGMYLRIVRAIDLLTAQPEWDHRVIAVIGHSQGGGQALVAGGIDDRVTFIATGVPAICDHAGMQRNRINGWPKLVPTDASGTPDATILAASRYVDAVNFASRCQADAIMSVGFIDAVCPPSSCYAAYNQLQGSKTIITEPMMGHAAPEHVKADFLEAIRTHVRKTKPGTIELTGPQQERCLEIIRAGMLSDEFWPAMHAAEALTLAGHGAEVIEYLSPRVSLETDDQQRCGLARELVRAGDRSHVRLMLDILNQSDTYGYTHAAESLFKVNEIGDGGALRRVMNSTADMKTRLMAAAALARSGDAVAFHILRRALASDDEQTYRIAAWILARIGNHHDILQLNVNLEKVQDPVVKATLEHALASLGDAAGLQALAENLHSPDPAIRTYAATFAGDARATETRSRLFELLDDENLDVRIRSAQTLLVLSHL